MFVIGEINIDVNCMSNNDLSFLINCFTFCANLQLNFFYRDYGNIGRIMKKMFSDIISTNCFELKI